MSVDVPFPIVSEKDPTAGGVVGTWFVLDGEPVTEGQLIAEVQVEKVSLDLYAPATGALWHAVSEGEATQQGAVIAIIE